MLIIAADGTRMEWVAGALRNDGSGWCWINNDTHEPTGPWTVTALPDRLRIGHPVGACKVMGSFDVTVDETYARLEVRAGISAGLDHSDIYCYRKDSAVAVNPATLKERYGNLWVDGHLKIPDLEAA